MFAKRPPAEPLPRPPTSRAKSLLTRPQAGAVASFMLFAGLAGVLAFTSNDQRSGAPTIRLSLAHIDDVSDARGPLTPTPWAGAADTPKADGGAVEFSSVPDLVADAGAINGQVLISMPDAGGSQPAQSRTSFAGTSALPQAPLPGLSINGPAGPLPVIAADGRTAAQAYARPFVANGHPRVALIIGGLGLNAKATRQAIADLPPEITLSFVPYADGLQGWIDMARAAGHEVLLEAPMEPKDYPENDPGPYTLMADAPSPDTIHRLEWLLSRATGYYGLTNYLGSKFTASSAAMATFDGALRARGLAFIDDGSAPAAGGGLPRASANRIIDDQLSATAIDQQLTALETQASRSGFAVGSGFAYPVTLEEATRWASALSDRGYQLAPASAVMTLR
ncbi:MAG TPA: divergent polysaccharide deacetylase family protein [Caulobacteraceae bacterium]